jgi:ATP-dependent DNA ligase
VVIGWTDPEGARPFRGALLLGYYNPDGRLTYAGRVGTGIDIWRAATLMLKRYGERALEESASRADELASASDDNGVAVWRRITDAVGQLANTIPLGAVH